MESHGGDRGDVAGGRGHGGLKIQDFSVDAGYYEFGQIAHTYKGQNTQFCAPDMRKTYHLPVLLSWNKFNKL